MSPGNLVKFLGLLTVCLGVTIAAAQAQTNVMLIFDASGSMKVRTGTGETRFAVAQRAMADLLTGFPSEVRLGLLLYGHRRAKDCADMELVSPLGADGAAAIARRIAGLQALGETPIADSLLQALRSFGPFKGQQNRIVLVTDGIEECRGDPCAVARSAKGAGVDVLVDVVGFTLNEQQRQTVQCIADATGGKYYDAQDAQGLRNALVSVRRQVVQGPPPAPAPPPPAPTRINLLSPKNGGELLVSPGNHWQPAADDKEVRVGSVIRPNEEAIYGFRDGRPATFDTFTVFIEGAEGTNPKEIELLASEELTGQFRSVATCTFLNARLAKSLYQPCKFAPVTARYLKVKVLSSFHGHGIYPTEFQLLGELGEAKAGPAATSAPSQRSTKVNLLSPKNGGELLVSPGNHWQPAADDKEVRVGSVIRPNEEAIYGFRDGRPATFDTFTVFIEGAEGTNPKEIELLASEEGLTGQFRPIATCTFLNARLAKSLYQPCKFAPVTARYLKVKVLSSFHGHGIYPTEFQLLGELGEAKAGPAATSAPPQPAQRSTKVNLLSPKNGGELLVSPGNQWQPAADDKEVRVGSAIRPNEEAIYGFRDERPATFDTFTVYIDGAEGTNPKGIELLAGDEGLTGQFRPIATCTFLNARLAKSLYQPCKFAPVTARYLKVKVLSSFHGHGIYPTEFQLLGELKQ